MLINESAVPKVAHVLREAIYEINDIAKKKALDIYILYDVMETPVFNALKAQGKKLTTVNKLRTEAGLGEITKEQNIQVIHHNHIGHISKNERGLGKGLTFTASYFWNHTKVPKWLEHAAEKVADKRGLDFHAKDNHIYIGVKDSDAVLQ